MNRVLLKECRSAPMPVIVGITRPRGGLAAAAVRGPVLWGHPLTAPTAPAFRIASPWAPPGSASGFPGARADLGIQTCMCSHPGRTAKGWRSTETTRVGVLSPELRQRPLILRLCSAVPDPAEG